jgi:hypothetical protein
MTSVSGSFASGCQCGFADNLPRDQRIERGGLLTLQKAALDARGKLALTGEA